MGSYTSTTHSSTNYCQGIRVCPFAVSIVGKALLRCQTFVLAVRCRRWSCKVCRELNKRVMYARVLAGRPEKLLTLTCVRLGTESPAETYKRCRPLVTRLVQAMRRLVGCVEACTVTEVTKNGMPHFHLLMRCAYVSQAWLSEKWLALSGAKVVDIRRVREGKRAAAYVVKYLVKAVTSEGGRRFGRVVSFTRQYALKPRDSFCKVRCTWERFPDHPGVLAKYVPDGWRCDEIPGGWTLYPVSRDAFEAEEKLRKDRLNAWLFSHYEGARAPPKAVRVVQSVQKNLFR